MSFPCPQCGAIASVILTRRPADNTIRRRHQCVRDPYHRFTTVQQVVKDYERAPREPQEEPKP